MAFGCIDSDEHEETQRKIILLEREIKLMKDHFQHNSDCEKISGYYAFMACSCGFEDKKNQIERMKNGR